MERLEGAQQIGGRAATVARLDPKEEQRPSIEGTASRIARCSARFTTWRSKGEWKAVLRLFAVQWKRNSILLSPPAKPSNASQSGANESPTQATYAQKDHSGRYV